MPLSKAFLMCVAVSSVLTFILACSGSSDPQNVSFTVVYENGQPVDGVQTFEAKQGDTVTFRYETDTAGNFHIHGYDIETEVEAGEVEEAVFEADITGRFAIEIEELEQDVAFLEVQPR